MIDLTKLEKLAEAATPGPWTSFGVAVFRCAKDPPTEETDFIASMNPQTALALIRVARAAHRVYSALSSDLGHCSVIQELEEALKEISP